MNKELMPCPFCSSSEQNLSSNGFESCFVTCECGTEGPACDTEAQAVIKWNTRTTIEAQAGQSAPVAWWIPKAEQFCLQPKDGSRPFAKAWEPLYTGPAPVRQPLSEAEIWAIVKEASRGAAIRQGAA